MPERLSTLKSRITARFSKVYVLSSMIQHENHGCQNDGKKKSSSFPSFGTLLQRLQGGHRYMCLVRSACVLPLQAKKVHMIGN